MEVDIWKDYMCKMGMQWINVFDFSNCFIYKIYYVNVMLEIYVLGFECKIIVKNLNVD